MPATDPIRKDRLHCLTSEPIPSIGGVSLKPECEPGPGTGTFRFKCHYTLPRYIRIGWTLGDGKRAWWGPMTDPNLSFPSPQTTTVTQVTESGENPIFGLSFRLDDAIAKEYYYLAGAFSSWKGNLAAALPMRELGSYLYALEAPSLGKLLEVTTVTNKIAYVRQGLGQVGIPGSEACRQTLTDTAKFRQVITGGLLARCNQFSYGDNGQPIGPTQILEPYDNWVTFEVVVAAGLVPEETEPGDYGPNTHLICTGQLPQTGYGLPPTLNAESLYNLLGFPAYPESLAAAANIGWPLYGRGSAAGRIRITGQAEVTTNEVTNGFSAAELMRYGPVGSPVTFTATAQ